MASLDEPDFGCLTIHRVRTLRSYLSSDGRRMVCVYQAPDVESVRVAKQKAGVPATRLWAARRYAL